ncbi:MAG TPA: ParB N-terminal domain-containing protein [Clostridia bacterium]|nr:ParB N-terminal domain-containing protein [Clostridia bacterium]
MSEPKQVDIKEIKLNKVKPASYNPRKDLKPEDETYQQLKKSIDKLGFTQILVYNERTGNLVSGHQSLKVLKDLGYKKVKMGVVDLPIDKEKQLNIALNNIEGEWDRQQLAGIISELGERDVDLMVAGFNYKEIDNLLDEIEAEKDIDYFTQIIEEEKNTSEEKRKEAEVDGEKIKQNPIMDLEGLENELDNLSNFEKAKVKKNKAEKLKKLAKQYSDDFKNNNPDPQEYSNFSITLKYDQKKFLVKFLNNIKKEYNLETQTEAILKLCEIYKERKGD